MRLLFPLCFVFTLVFTRAASAQQLSPAPERPSVRVHGESNLSVEPDQVEMDIAVVTQGATTQAASDNNTQQANAVVQSLRAILPPANIKTVNVSINPNFRYPKEGAPVIQGYTATNTVRVVIDDLSLLRKVISASTKAGATSINRLNFMLRSEKDVRARALAEAADQAREGADALALSLKLKLGRILRVEEGQPVIVSPAPQMDIGKAQSTDMTPLSPGYIQIHANVDLTYELQ